MSRQLALIYGGVDGEREVSLMAHEHMRQSLSEVQDIELISIEVDTKGGWHKDGKAIDPNKALEWIDYAWITGAGEYMEDGTLQKILDQQGVPYNGSDALMSRICFSKKATKDILEEKGIQTPAGDIYKLSTQSQEDLANTIFQTIPQPCVIKPDRGGSSLGVYLVDNYQDIVEALARLADADIETIVVEECMQGREATVGVVEDMRDEAYYALPPVEIIPHGEFFDYQAKYEGASEEVCPACFSDELTQELQSLAQRIHSELELDDYSRADFIVHPERGIYTLEVNTLPGMTQASLVPKELEAVGISMAEFVKHIIDRELS